MTSSNTNTPAQPSSVGSQMSGLITNTRVGWKLAIVIAVLVGGTLGIFISGIVGLQSLNYHILNIYSLKLVPISAIGQAETSLVNAQDQLRILHNARLTPEQLASAFKIIAESEKSFNQVLVRYEKEWLTSYDKVFTSQLQASGKLDLQKEEEDTLAALKTSYQAYVTQRKIFQAIQEKGLYDAASEDAALAAISETRTHLRHLIIVNTEFADLSNVAAQVAYQRAILAMGSTLLVATLIGLALAFVVTRSITDRLNKMTQAARSLEQGAYQQSSMNTVTGSDEIGEMAQAFDAMATQMNQVFAEMETRVNTRTLELQDSTGQLIQRAAQLEAVSEVSSSIAAIRDIEVLLPTIARLISERFGFYHTGIFTLNENKDYAVLSAASSTGGQRMMARKHQLRVGAGSLVGFVANRGIPRIALDVEQDAMHNANPDLPETRSEMALPLLAGSNLIGVLDVQSTQASAFSEQDINILTTLANQVAAAMQNARLFTDTRQALGEAEKIYNQFVQHGWQQITSSDANRGYRYSAAGLEIVSAPIAPGLTDATSTTYAIPLRLRDQTIGFMHISSGETGREWDSDELALIQAAADRAALALENARLLDESQRRASKERVIGEITSRISAAANTESILKTAVGELATIISDTDISIQFIPVQDTSEQA